MLACMVIGAVCLVFKGLLIYYHIVLNCYHQLSSYYQSIVFQIHQPINCFWNKWNCFWNKWKIIIIKQIVCVVILMHTNNRNKLLFQTDRKGESYDSPEIPGRRVPSDISGNFQRPSQAQGHSIRRLARDNSLAWFRTMGSVASPKTTISNWRRPLAEKWQKSKRTRQKNKELWKTGVMKSDSPEILDRGETSNIPWPPFRADGLEQWSQ